MAELRAEGLSLRLIGCRFGLSRQAVHLRLKARGGGRVSRLPTFAERIDQEKLKNLYATDLSLGKIGSLFGVSNITISDALKFHKIPVREYPKLGGKYIDSFRRMKIGESLEMEGTTKKRFSALYGAARSAGIRISVKTTVPGRFTVTRVG